MGVGGDDKCAWPSVAFLDHDLSKIRHWASTIQEIDAAVPYLVSNTLASRVEIDAVLLCKLFNVLILSK
jgi:hypothetical protein